MSYGLASSEDRSFDPFVEYIGYVTHSSFVEKWGTPRQSGMAPASQAILQFNKQKVSNMFVKNLASYTHIIILFYFHLNKLQRIDSMCQSNTKLDSATVDRKSSATPYKEMPFMHGVRQKIKPPKMGGSKFGCFATRSPHRPNQIGLSIVKVDSYLSPTNIRISDVDLVVGTPVVYCSPWSCARHGTLSGILQFPKWLSNSIDLCHTHSTGSGHCFTDKERNLYPPHRITVYFSFASFLDLYPPAKCTPCDESVADANHAPDSQKAAIYTPEEVYDLRSLVIESLSLDPRSIHSQRRHRNGVFAMRLSNAQVIYKHYSEYVALEDTDVKSKALTNPNVLHPQTSEREVCAISVLRILIDNRSTLATQNKMRTKEWLSDLHQVYCL